MPGFSGACANAGTARHTSDRLKRAKNRDMGLGRIHWSRMIYRFGVFEFDAERGELRKNGRTVALEPQPAKALTLLLARAGDIVSREDLRDAVWGSDTHVDFDRGLAYCVSQIRSALGDSGENPRFLQTLPRKGFKFIAPIDGPPAVPGPAADVRTARNYW